MIQQRSSNHTGGSPARDLSGLYRGSDPDDEDPLFVSLVGLAALVYGAGLFTITRRAFRLLGARS